MTLASGAHVKLGAYEYLIDESEEGHYQHGWEPLLENEYSVGGSGLRSTRPDLLFWEFTDWSGGQGYKTFDPGDPIVYWYGNCNPRREGSVKGPPTQTAGTGLSTTSNTPHRVLLAASDGRLWLAANRQLFYSTDGTSWTAHGSNPLGSAGNQITGLAADGKYVWVALSSTVSGTGTRKVLRCDTSTATTFVSDVSTTLPFWDLAVYEGGLYGWTGRNLVRYKANTSSLPITHSDAKHNVAPLFDDTVSTNFIARMVEGEHSLWLMNSFHGKTIIYEWRADTLTPVWTLPDGFKGKGLTVSNGVVYVGGDYLDTSAIFGLSTSSRVPTFATSVLKDGDAGTTSVSCMGGSFGNQILIGDAENSSNATVYVYDRELDSLTSLGEVSSWGELSAVTTFRNKRIMAGFNGTTLKTVHFNTDYASTTQSWDLYSGDWDQGYPYAEKVLLGVHVVCEPLPASGTLSVYYQDDEDGAWTLAGTVSGTNTSYQYLPVSTTSTTEKFHVLRIRVDGTNGAVLKSLAVRSNIAEYNEVWSVTLKLQDETTANGSRPRNRLATAATLRDNLETLSQGKNLVTFLDGYRYKEPGRYTTHSVTIEAPTDIINRLAEGNARVILRSSSVT